MIYGKKISYLYIIFNTFYSIKIRLKIEPGYIWRPAKQSSITTFSIDLVFPYIYLRVVISNK